MIKNAVAYFKKVMYNNVEYNKSVKNVRGNAKMKKYIKKATRTLGNIVLGFCVMGGGTIK